MRDDDVEYAGFWPRVGASLIDIILLLIITTPPLVSIYGWEYFTDPDRPLIAGLPDFLVSWVMPAVATILFWVWKRATPGKMAVSVQVVDARTGSSLTVLHSVIRYLAYFVAMLPLFLGIIWVAFDPRKQGWHDKLAGTVVIRPKFAARCQ